MDVVDWSASRQDLRGGRFNLIIGCLTMDDDGSTFCRGTSKWAIDGGDFCHLPRFVSESCCMNSSMSTLLTLSASPRRIACKIGAIIILLRFQEARSSEV